MSQISQGKKTILTLFSKTDILDLMPGDDIFKDVDVIFHFAGIGDIVPSIENPLNILS